jgi:hypothetical protein
MKFFKHQDLTRLELLTYPSGGINPISKYEDSYGMIPNDLKQLYSITNGIEGDNFRILPLYDESNSKKTWDNLERANNPLTSKFSLDSKLLDRFLIFGEIGGNHCAMFDKSDYSIWFEDDNGYHRTDLNLEEFIEGLVKESIA